MRRDTVQKLRKEIRLRRNRFWLAGSGINFDNFEHKHNVSIYPRYKLIYNRMKKSGNTTITAFLNDIIGSDTYENARELKKCLVKPENLTFRQLLDLKNYYSFTVVRNPYYRVLSAYLEKLTGQDVREKYNDLPGSGDSSADGFTAFVQFLADGGIYHNRHWWPQADSLFQAVDNFSYIGRLENIVEDMGRILSENRLDPELALRLAKPHDYEIQKSETRITSAQRRVAEFYSDETIALVASLYTKDFEVFGYTKDPEWM